MGLHLLHYATYITNLIHFYSHYNYNANFEHKHLTPLSVLLTLENSNKTVSPLLIAECGFNPEPSGVVSTSGPPALVLQTCDKARSTWAVLPPALFQHPPSAGANRQEAAIQCLQLVCNRRPVFHAFQVGLEGVPGQGRGGGGGTGGNLCCQIQTTWPDMEALLSVPAK